MVGGRWFDLASLMLTSADLVFPKASEKDLECIFTIICSLVKKPESLDESLEIAKIAQQPNEKPALRLKILFNLYNMLENPYGRFLVYMKALEVADNGKVTEHIISSFKKIDTLLKEWNIGLQDQRELFLAISNILKELKSSAKENFKFLTKYLATFSGEATHDMDEAKEKATYTIIEFVKAPDMFQVLFTKIV
uniref:eukaryotic translation initiation factor 3 subunit M-like isoform X2 n=1 Tax=Erigeron canadensis TaxID=72917 RepID=UPI001CB9D2E8|nr:eukaryotic translation initiation factor 3 subunit M-like isoform X2 [Erigeron canadensis]